MKPFAPLLLLTMLLPLGCGGSDDPSAEGGGGTGGSGGQHATGGAGGNDGAAGSAGHAGRGGHGGGHAGEGGHGNAGSGGDDSIPCLPGAGEGACQECIADALLSCTAAAPSCAQGFFAFSTCAVEAGCFSTDGADWLCAAQACPEEAMQMGGCLATCPALRACAGH